MASGAASRPVELCTDAAAAAVRTAAGIDVLLILVEGVPLVDRPPGPGRVAVLVGRADEPADRAAALTMSAELFGTGAELFGTGAELFGTSAELREA